MTPSPRSPAAHTRGTSSTAPRSAAVEIRQMRPHEAEIVGRFTLASYDAYGRIEGPYRDFLADPQIRAAGCTELLVADIEGEPVGTVTFVLPGDTEWEGCAEPDGDASFRVLAVAPGAEGHGVGRALVEACLSRAKARDCRRVSIISMSWMSRAHRLYTGLGFARRPDLDVRFPGGDGVAFTLDLTSDAARHFRAPGPIPPTPSWFEEAWGR